jgi:uncharacterized protein (TIGR04255 family)
MSGSNRYPKAPITEAVIDFRVESRPEVKVKDLKKAVHGRKAAYPKQEDIILFEAQGKFQTRPGPSASANAQHKRLGFKFTSQDGKQVWESRINGFTFCRLAPYESWELFREEAKQLWTVYRNEFHPRKVTRVAVRYINRINIQAERVELKEYFRTSPEISPDLPQLLEGFFMQLRLPQADLQAQTLINQTIVEPSNTGAISVILDIDVFRHSDVPQEEQEIWNFFERLRVCKNVIFEACLTDKTRELFQ